MPVWEDSILENARATEILACLADGVNPTTGERFPPDSPYQEADTVRALYLAVRALGRSRAGRARRNGSGNSGKPWTPEEELALIRQFDDGTGLSEIAAEHQRSRYAIEIRLARLGKLPPEQFPDFTRNGRPTPGQVPRAGL